MWRHGFDAGYLMTTLRRSYADFHYHQDGDSHNPYVSNISFERESSVRTDIELEAAPTTTISAGIEGRSARLDNSLKTTVFATGFIRDTLVLPIDIAADTLGTKAAAYLQVAQSLGNLTLTAGLRGDYLGLITHKSVLAPRLIGSFAFTPISKISMSAGRYYQAPSYIWLMANPYNHDLKYLAMNQYVIGVEHYFRSDLKVSLEAYSKDYFNYPVSLSRPYLVMVNTSTELREVAEAYTAFGLDFLQSSGMGFAQGIDLFIEKRLSEIPFYGRLTVSYSKAMFKALDGISRPSNSDQRWKVNIGCGYVIDECWEVTSSFRFYTGQPYTPFNLGVWERDRSDYNSARLGANHSMDARIARRWNFESRSLNAYLDIQNIYNRKQLEPPSWNQQKNIPEDRPALGIVPSLGLSLEF